MEKIPVCEPLLGERDLKNVTECIKSGWISGKGRYVNEFEGRFASYCRASYGISTTSGTTALHLAMLALGIGKGDEVIVPDFTMIASANSVVYAGAMPVWVDSEPRTWNIDPAKIEEKITKKTKAIMVMHTYGHPADMDPVLKIADERGLMVIEDAAEAHGAEYKGKRVGCLGNVGCFSFYANKIVTTGEGGLVVTNDEGVAERARLFKDLYFDKERKYIHRQVGFNYRLSNIQAALGLAQLERIDEIIKMKRDNAELYNSLLKGIEGIVLPPEMKWAKNVYWMYTVLVGDEFGLNRDAVKRGLEKKGIDTRFAFSPMHVQPCFARLGFSGKDEDYPVAVGLSRRGLYLPSAPSLKEEQIRYVCESIKELGK